MTLDHTAEFGIDAGRVEHLVAEAEAAVQAGLTPSCQLALAREGRVALFTALGQATTGHRYVVFSVTKALIAAAMWILLDEGMLTRSTHVVELVPEFGTNGKEAVTVQHLLTHTAGFPRAPMHPLEGGTREERVRRFEQWWLDWEPGTRFEYHPSSAHWVLAHLIQAVTGDDYRSWIKQRVISPFGLRRLELGAPRAEQEDVLDVRMIGEMAGRRALSDAGIQNADYLLAEMGARQLLRYNEPDVREVGVPGAGGVSTAADVALFFQALLHNPDGMWDPATLAAGTTEVLVRHPDPFTRVPANRTLGLVAAGDDGGSALRGFGLDAPPRSFGSPGAGGQIAWGDPDSGLSFCYLTNGLDADIVRGAQRSIRLSTLAASCARR